MSTTEDTAMSSDRAPPERPAAGDEATDAIDAEREAATDPLSHITTEPGDRYSENVELLIIEAELACVEGKALANPAKIPAYADNVAERFTEALENHEHDLVPAWTRPWEGDDE
jgi:hypothetical protein